jgi:CTD kinase subunit alpha
MVFEYIDHDLTGLLNHPDVSWEPKHIKCIAKQIFEGVQHLHQHNIIHRDMKGIFFLRLRSRRKFTFE